MHIKAIRPTLSPASLNLPPAPISWVSVWPRNTARCHALPLLRSPPIAVFVTSAKHHPAGEQQHSSPTLHLHPSPGLQLCIPPVLGQATQVWFAAPIQPCCDAEVSSLLQLNPGAGELWKGQNAPSRCYLSGCPSHQLCSSTNLGPAQLIPK